MPTVSKIIISQPIELPKGDEVEPIAHETYPKHDPQCDWLADWIPDANGSDDQERDASGNRSAPMPWQAERAAGDAAFAWLRDSEDSPLHGEMDRWGSYADRRYIESLLAPLLSERDREEVEITVHIVSAPLHNLGSQEPDTPILIGGHLLVPAAILSAGPLSLASEAELVALLAHELGHADMRHVSRALARSRVQGEPLNQGVFAPKNLWLIQSALRQFYGSELEEEADRYAVERLLRLAYSPYEFDRLRRRWASETPAVIDCWKGMERTDESLKAERDRAYEEARRICHLRPLIRAFEPRTTLTRLYKGRRNLRDRVALRDRTY